MQAQNAAPDNRRKQIIGLLFSKDRPLQLDAALNSFFHFCCDADLARLVVLYAVSNPEVSRMYQLLAQNYPQVEFRRETNFAEDLLSALFGYQYLLTFVDDNLCVRPFSLAEATAALHDHPDALGVSLRLGKNTTYCYALSQAQALPAFSQLGGDLLKFNWTVSQADFGYPLELSSSIYDLSALRPLLQSLRFTNPNTLEGELAARARIFAQAKPWLLCYEKSRAFCAPLNMVQSTCPNRAGKRPEYSANALSELFKSGMRVKISAYENYTPQGCHEEINLVLEEREKAMTENTSNINQMAAALAKPVLDPAADHLQQLIRAKNLPNGAPLKLHLGCGETNFPDYINIDFPPSEHTVQRKCCVDLYANILELKLPASSVAEVRLHHVFEHFDRPSALGLLCIWQAWLKPGGRLHIEVPDAEACAQMAFDKSLPWATRQAVVRHLFGSHEAHWAVHYDGWFEERFRRTLGALGFDIAEIKRGEWLMLRNITVVAVKNSQLPFEQVLFQAGSLLCESLVDNSESELSLLKHWQENMLKTVQDKVELH